MAIVVPTVEAIEADLNSLKEFKIETEEQLAEAIHKAKVMFGQLNLVLAQVIMELKESDMLQDDDEVQTHVFTTADGEQQIMILKNTDTQAITLFKDGVGNVVSPHELLTESSPELVQQIMADPGTMKILIAGNE